ncbi:MAG: hypothetical protein ACYCSZ_12555 [Burkholderiales bacterium]
MPIITSTASKKQAKSTTRVNAGKAAASAGSQMYGRPLSGPALLEDMAAYRKAVSATPESAREFLTRLGVLTRSGKPKKLIRG